MSSIRHNINTTTRYDNKSHSDIPEDYRRNLLPNEREYQFLLGSLLGDGCIVRPCSLFAWCYFSVGHGPKQHGYLRAKKDILHRFHPYISKNKKTDYWVCNTRAFKYLRELRDIWYPEGKKIIPEMVADLDPFGLAIWYMDDGAYDKKFSRRISLLTMGFPKDSVLCLRDILFEKFELPFKYQPYGNYLRLPRRYINNFWSLTAKYCIGEMGYKFGLV